MKKSSLIALIGVVVLLITQCCALVQQFMLPSYRMSWGSVFIHFFEIVGLVLVGVYFISQSMGKDIFSTGNGYPGNNYGPRQQQFPQQGPYQQPPYQQPQPGNNGYERDSSTIIKN